MTETGRPAVQDHYPDDFAWCYGCGRLNRDGLHVRTTWDGDETVSRFTPRPEHMAVPGYVYGGLLASLIDCHAMATASGATLRAAGKAIGSEPSPRFVTGSLKVDYLKPTPLGPELEIRARPVAVGERKVSVQATVSAGGVITVKGEALAVRMPPSMGKTA